MARGRMINRGVSTSQKVASLISEEGPWAGLLHHRLIAFLDKNGNCRADPYWIKAEIFPRHDGITPEDCRRLVGSLPDHGLAVLYEVSGMPYLHFPGFRSHQVGLRPDRESPEVPVPEGFNEDAGCLPDSFRQPAGYLPEDCPQKRSEGEVEVEGEVSSANADSPEPDPVPDLWAVWIEELGGKPPHPKLTRKRRTKLRALYRECLKSWPDPTAAFRQILRAVQGSEHHMSKREYQMPESLFLNEERRDRWREKGLSVNGKKAHPYKPPVKREVDEEYQAELLAEKERIEKARAS